jgi:hypothetical protein
MLVDLLERQRESRIKTNATRRRATLRIYR